VNLDECLQPVAGRGHLGIPDGRLDQRAKTTQCVPVEGQQKTVHEIGVEAEDSRERAGILVAVAELLQEGPSDLGRRTLGRPEVAVLCGQGENGQEGVRGLRTPFCILGRQSLPVALRQRGEALHEGPQQPSVGGGQGFKQVVPEADAFEAPERTRELPGEIGWSILGAAPPCPAREPTVLGEMVGNTFHQRGRDLVNCLHRLVIVDEQLVGSPNGSPVSEAHRRGQPLEVLATLRAVDPHLLLFGYQELEQVAEGLDEDEALLEWRDVTREIGPAPVQLAQKCPGLGRPQALDAFHGRGEADDQA
jgi:hypothetical protein